MTFFIFQLHKLVHLTKNDILAFNLLARQFIFCKPPSVDIAKKKGGGGNLPPNPLASSGSRRRISLI